MHEASASEIITDEQEDSQLRREFIWVSLHGLENNLVSADPNINWSLDTKLITIRTLLLTYIHVLYTNIFDLGKMPCFDTNRK